MWKFRLACLGYFAVLTFLLLTPDPAALLGLRHFPGIGGAVGVHFAAFAVLGIFVAASRFPLRPALLAGLLLLYAVGVELLQFSIPQRTVETRDLLENLLGLLAGVAIWQFAAKCRILTWRDAMPEKERFRFVTREGLVTYDTFVLSDEQPGSIKANCVLLVDEANGRLLTVHRTRLVPVEDPGVQAPDRHRRSVCLKCGKVEGIVGDQVVCPYHGEAGCDLLEAQP